MALIKCPECGKQMSDTAPSCPHCGYVDKVKDDEPIKYAQPKKFKIGFRGWVFIALIFVLGWCSVNYYGKDSGNGNKNKIYNGQDAYIEAQAFAKKHLKAPNTAEFPYYHTIENNIEYLGTNKYKIDAYVDSQNSFGAQIRTNFSCTIIFIGGGQVQCKDLIFDD